MIKFKNTELIREYFGFLNREARRVCIDLEEIASQEGFDLMVTSIKRTKADQERICKEIGKEYYPSLHMSGNAIDLVPAPKLTMYSKKVNEKMENLCSIINNKHPYGLGKNTALWHMGTGMHLHIQVNPRQFGFGKVYK